jgi:ABC-type branched-chain amino acid transport systems, ATPase component
MAEMTTPAIQAPDLILHARKVTKAFGGLVAVKEVDLEIPRGAIISLIGPNGAGKTTFFNVIVGILDPTAGDVRISGRRMIGRPVRAWMEPVVWVVPSVVIGVLTALAFLITGSNEVAALGAAVALFALAGMFLSAIIRPGFYVRLLHRVGIFRSAKPNEMAHVGIGRTFQNIRLFANMTALENVMVGMHLKLHANAADALLDTRRARREEVWARDRAGELLDLVGLRGRGEVLARNLPYGDQRRLEIAPARALGGDPTLLLLDEPTAGMNPRETVDMMALINKLRSELGLSVLLIEHDMRVVMGISDRICVLDHGERIAEGTPAGDPGEPQGHRGVSREAARMTTSQRASEITAPAGELLLELKDVHTYYGRIHALQGISLEVRRGEIVTLIGANGAGKTTILKTISGLLHAREGQVLFKGADITQTPAHALVKQGIGHAPEGRRIFSRLTVFENLQMGAFTRTQAEAQEDVERMYQLFPRLKERATQRGGSLSGGEQQMLAVGRALMSRPTVLLLDEPSLGLSPILVQEIFAIITEINRQGTTILLVEQNALQALHVAHRGYVLQTGRVLLADEASRLAANQDVRRAYLGEI